MKPFAETSFLFSLYRGDVFSDRAETWIAKCGPGLPVSTLVRFEFRQSIRLQTRLYASDPALGLTVDTARELLRMEAEDERGGVWKVLPLDWADVHVRAEALSDRHTWDEAHRFADILHVATALCLQCDTFLTFDARQARMAEAEGLSVPVS